MFRFSAIEQGLRKTNGFFERFMPILTPTGVILGLLLASFFMPLKPIVTPLFAFLTLVNGMGVSILDFGRVVRKPKPIFLFMLCVYLVAPLVMTTAAHILFSGSPDTVTGFALLYAIPTAVVGSVWSGIYNGNAALSLAMLVIGTLLAPIMTPYTVRILSSSEITMDVSGMMLSLLWMVVIPSVIGIAINAATKGSCTKHAVPCLKPFTKVALLLVIIINSSQVAEELIAAISWTYVPQFVASFVFAFSGYFMAYAIGRIGRLERRDLISMTFASSMKNISAAMVIAIDFFPPGAVLPIIFGIVLQQSTCALSAHILFGRKPEKIDNNKGDKR